MSVIDQFLYVKYDIVYVFRHSRFVIGGHRFQSFEVILRFLDIIGADVIELFPFSLCPIDDLIIDIREIPHIIHFISEVFEIVPYDVEIYGLSCMTYVRLIIDRYPASVHLQFVRF
jgi:hypothetical protein